MPRFHCRVRNGSDRKGAASGLVLGTATEESREWGRNGYGKVRVTPTFGSGNATRPAPLRSDPFRTLQWKRAISLRVDDMTVEKIAMIFQVAVY
ncbi:unnamed protein product [Boreogadus saida]